MKPTLQAYDELQRAYDHFNNELFDGVLPDCLITLQREKQTYGYFSPERFVNSQGTRTDEIAMNPAYFAVCPPKKLCKRFATKCATYGSTISASLGGVAITTRNGPTSWKLSD
ncbi:hypothetical protein ACTG22_21335 [Aeromonas caviae]|uniref:hypothetical protein n=1 Tax=Aeromonas caviae TaxID=648 RepID=UPI003F7A0053